MPKKRTFAVKAEYRAGMSQVVADVLDAAGIDYGDRPIQFHLDGTVSIELTDAEPAALESSTDVTIYAGPGNSGIVRIATPETDDFFAENSPVLTETERAERQRKAGEGKRIINREQAEARKAALEARKRRLAELHGVDLDEAVNDEA